MFKKIISSVLPLALALPLTVSAFAAGPSFTDVPADSLWYESVEYIAERGITNGTGNGCYAPDALLSVRQWTVLLCRAYNKTEALAEETGAFGDACLAEAYRNGWLSTEGMMDPGGRMCRGALYESAFSAAGLHLYDYSLYPDGRVLSRYDNCLRVAVELGLCPEVAAAGEFVTRGEAAILLHAILTQAFQLQGPPVCTEFPIENPAGVNMNSFLLELARVPGPILQAFREKGWIYAIDFDYLARLSRERDMSCVGATNYGARYIYVSEPGATLHEFGHFLDGALCFPTSREAFMEQEMRASMPFLRDYARSNTREYFADCFVYFLNYQDDPTRLALMQENAPHTYAYFLALMEKGWTSS